MFKWNYPLTRNCQDALDEAVRFAANLNSADIGTEHILYGLVRIDGVASRLLKEGGLTLDSIKENIPPNGHENDEVKTKPSRLTPIAKEAMESALDYSRKGKKDHIGSEHILMALLENRLCMASGIMRKCGVNAVRTSADILVSMGYDARFFHEEDGNGLSFPILLHYSRDLINDTRQTTPIIGRQKEMNRVIQTLSRRMKNNPCLIGEPGVGKTAVVEGLAQRIAQGRVPDSLKDKRILQLDLSGMVAGSKYRGDFEEKMKRVIREAASDRNVLLFLDEIHTLIGAGGSEGSLDAANILKPALSRGEIQLIGATTVDEYRKHIEKDAALERRFQPIMIEEPSEAQTEEILMGIRSGYDEYHGLTITDGAVKAAVRLSSRYINDRFRPDKCIDLLDEACAAARLRQDRQYLRSEKAYFKDPLLAISRLTEEQENAIRNNDMHEVSKLQGEIEKLKARASRKSPRRVTASDAVKVTEEDIAGVTAEMTGIPIQRLAESESSHLRNLEKVISKRVVGQAEAVSAVAKAVRRGRVGLKDPHRPIGSFLFLGPTGVGKTELSKALAEALFGKEDAMIRIDMSEYMEKHSVSKIIGSPPGYVGYDEGGQLSEKVRRNPYSVILFDEIEKAHPDVFHILLQVLDDGHITDSQGRRIDFKNTIIIMTSNVGAQRIIEPKNLGFGKTKDVKANYETMKSNVMEEVKRLFRPEFLNRIDDMLVFHPLSREDMVAILDIMVGQLNRRTKEAMGIHITMAPKAKERMIDIGYSEKYGARPLRRALQTEIEDRLTDGVLSGNIKSGDNVSIREKDGAFVFVTL